jgi:hypothetical protein
VLSARPVITANRSLVPAASRNPRQLPTAGATAAACGPLSAPPARCFATAAAPAPIAAPAPACYTAEPPRRSVVCAAWGSAAAASTAAAAGQGGWFAAAGAKVAAVLAGILAGIGWWPFWGLLVVMVAGVFFGLAVAKVRGAGSTVYGAPGSSGRAHR